MLKMVGQDIVSGAMGFVGTEPGKLYRMGSLNGVAEASGNPLTLKSLHTYAGVTNVSNDAEAWMQVVYDT